LFSFYYLQHYYYYKKKAEKKFYEPSYIYVKDYFFSFLNEFK